MTSERSTAMRQRNRLTSFTAIVGLALALVLMASATTAQAEEPTGLEAAVALEKTLVAAIASAEKSVVSIARTGPGQDVAAGDLREDIFGPFGPNPLVDHPTDPNFIPHEFATGVIVDRSGLILTNYHILAKDSQYWIRTVDRKTYEATVLAADVDSDLAVLRVNVEGGGTEFIPMTFGDTSNLRKGQIVIALGNPYAIARDGQASASWGIISNLARKPADKPASDNTLYRLGMLIQTDAKLNLGTSGGALLNLKGEMIGLTTSLAALAGYEQAGGYAIPVDDAFIRILNVLKAGRKVDYGYLGVMPVNLSYRETLGGKHGSKINTVSVGTPARRGALVPGDVVTHINRHPVYDADGLRLQVGKLAPGTTVSFTVERDGQMIDKQVTLAKRPSQRDGEKIFTVDDPDWRGLRVDFTTAVLKLEALSDMYDATLAISDVAKGSVAEQAGLSINRLVTHVNDKAVHTPDEFYREAIKHDGPVSIRLLSENGQTPTIVVPAK